MPRTMDSPSPVNPGIREGRGNLWSISVKKTQLVDTDSKYALRHVQMNLRCKGYSICYRNMYCRRMYEDF